MVDLISRQKVLAYHDGYGLLTTKRIAKEADRMCYTEVQND